MKINKLIYPLEPRIMLDGAAAVDVIDNVDDILQSKKTQTTDGIKFIEKAKDTSLPFVNVERDQRDQKNKNIVFIDAAVQDYQTLVDAFDAETEVHIVQSNQDGFLVMQNYLAQVNDVDAIHIIGHGSAGQIAFGTALLNESTLEDYKSSLSTIGASLTADGDILFYGCNIADGRTGETLINQIATITNADIAASDDVTGQGGDWDLEKHTGIIETKNIVVANYAHSLANGVASVDADVVELHSATNFRARWSGTNAGGQQDSSSDRFILTQERADVTGGAGTLSFDYAVAASSHTPSTDNPVHVYLLFSNDDTDSNSRRTGSRTGVVTFENEILGIFTQPTNTIAMTGISKSGATYPTSSSPKIGMRDLEYNNSNPPGTQGNKDWFRVYNSNKSVEIGTKNGLKGDFIRIITRAPVSNNAPVGNNDAGYINEDATLSVSNGASANDSTPDASGEHTGDVLLNDTDADSDTLTVSAISGGSLGSAVTGSYGQLTLYSNGSYSYVANQDAADALDPGDTVTDTFTYTVSDGTDTDTATITITIAGLNDDITAVNDTDAVNEDKTISRSTSDVQELDHDDTDPDGDDASGSFTITAIRTGRETGSGTSGTVGSALTGTYGVLTVNSNGSYSYAASTSGADGLSAGATAIDYFTYTVQDHSGGDTDTAELAITVTGVGPQAVNDTGAVNENATLSKNEAQGVISNDDDDASYDSESLAVTGIRTGTESGSGTSGTVGSALTGTYGVLTIAADGSYSYVANTAAAEALDANDEVTDVFTYTVSDDADVNSDTGQITITITGVDDDPVGVNDTGAVNEDATLSVNTASGVLSNDTDADDSASLTVSAISSGTVGQAKNGTYGALTLNSNGSYTYVANQSGADGLAAGATATDTFTYTVSDGAGTTDTATLTITVTGIGPQAVDDTGAVNEDATLSVNEGSGVISNDDDNSSYDSESLAITGIRTGAESGSGTSGSVGSALTGTYGQLTIAADGSYEYVANQNAADALDPGETATDTFTYTVKDDDNKNADTGEIVITVTGINDDITAVNDTDAVNAGATISRSESDAQELDQDDTDDDGDDVPGAFTITAIRTGATEGSGTAKTIGQAFTTTYGTLTVNANGTYTYAADQNGSTSLSNGATATDSFNYTVRDHASGDTDDATLVITITGSTNNAPVASNDTGYIVEDGTLTVGDGGSAVTGSDSNNNNESGDTTGDVLVGDTDADGDTLTVSAISGGSVGSAVTGTYGTLTIQSNGSYEYVADQSAADTLDAGDTVTDVFTYTVSDGNDGTDTATLTFTILGVDDDPVGVNDTGYINEDATLTVNDGGSAVTGSDSNNNNESADTTGDVLANDTDADGSSSLTVSAISGGTVGQALTGTYGTLTLNANGSYTYVANQSGADGLAADATATDTFTYTVSDGAGTTDTATLTITVKGVGPSATNDTGSVNEDATLSVNAGSGVTSNDTGGDTESLEVTNIRTGTESGSGTSGSVGTALTGTYGELTINADGSYEYVANQSAADALDPGETATDTFTYTVKDDDNKNADTGEIVITVTGINDEIIAVDDTDSVNEDATISRSTSDAQELDADDTDADGDDVPGAFTITAIRTGSESGSGTSGTIGQALTGTYGTLTVNADGSYTYVADQNAADSIVTGQTATDTFTYTVRDHSSGDTDTAELVFTVTGINDENPVAVNDTDSVNRDATIERAAGSSFDINADDTDADGDSLTITGIRVGQTEGGGASGTVGSELVGTYGTLTLNSDGSYTYTADQDAANSLKRGDSAIDYFNYTVSDGTNEDIGVIAITINGISDPPVPVDDTLAIDASAQTTKNSSSGVLVNDTDPDGDTITVDSIRTGQESGTGTTGTVGSVITGTYGDLTLNSDGSYTYQANNAKSVNPGDTVTDYFTYTATDSETSVPAQISITVTGINDPPEVISPINVPTLITDQNVVIKYTQAFDDPDSGSYDITQYKVIDPESEQETSLPTGLYIEGNKLKGNIKTPGDYSITLRAIDGAGLYVDHTFTIKVIPSPADIPETAENKPVKLKTIKVKPKKDLELSLAAFDNSDIPQIDETVLEKKLTFNGGMKVLNVVAQETQTTNELQVAVMVNDDNRQDVESYSGLLSDGTPLPEWVKVNPETGETSAAMPDDIDNVEVQVIALDKDGTVRDINIVLDKPAIKNDDKILRNDSNLFQGENIFVDGENKVNFVDDTIDRAARNIIELNKAQDEIDFTANLKLGNIAFSEGQYSINFIDDNKSNVSTYRIELDSGKSIPAWLSLNNKTGEILATPPSDEKVIGIKLIAEDVDGTERTIEVDIDFEEVLQSQDNLSYIPLNDQINEIVTSADNYGERLINQLG
ncbi:Ig-like domain-containing protein [Pelagibacteraceae bacterium]|nr:Ig-like domain-containing protein [Pelagibacteraceae bacterium]